MKPDLSKLAAKKKLQNPALRKRITVGLSNLLTTEDTLQMKAQKFFQHTPDYLTNKKVKVPLTQNVGAIRSHISTGSSVNGGIPLSREAAIRKLSK